MIQSGGVIIRYIPILGNLLSVVARKGTYIARNLGKHFLDKQIDKFNKEYILGKGSGITLINN